MSIFHRKNDSDTHENKRYKSPNGDFEQYEDQVEELIEKCNKIITSMPAISELKADIMELRSEIKERDAFLRELVLKLVDKPSLAQQYAAAKGAQQSQNNATAGPKGKLP